MTINCLCFSVCIKTYCPGSFIGIYMTWGHMRQYRYSELLDGHSGPQQIMHKYHTLYPLLQEGSSKGIPLRRLKEIHSYKCIFWDVTIHKGPFPVSISILLLICYLYFTQGPFSEEMLVLVITTFICPAHCSALGKGTIALTP